MVSLVVKFQPDRYIITMMHSHRSSLAASVLASLATLVASCGGTSTNLLEVGDSDTPPGLEFEAAPAEYAAAWGAKELCTRVFVAGGDPATTIDNELTLVGLAAEGFVLGDATIDIDEQDQRVTISQPGQPDRTSVYAQSQGCVILPRGAPEPFFEPREIEWRGPPADAPWPLGETVTQGSSPIDRVALGAALDRHMERFGARGVVVVHQGELIDERYAEGFGPLVPQRGWSTGKSVAATAVGRLSDQGLIDIDAPAPVAAWANDARRNITMRNMLQMSSGLDQQFEDGITAFFSPTSEHSFIYVEGFDTLADAVEVQPGAFEPGTEFSYRNTNVLTGIAIARMIYEQQGNDGFALIQREVFEPLGMRSSVAETDPYGNFIISGAFYTTPRDLARLALAHMQGGVLGDERVLSNEWSEFAYAPSQGDVIYGAWWRNNLDNRFEPMPTDAFFANGGFGQQSVAIPSRDLVIAQNAFDPFSAFGNFLALVDDVVTVVDESN